MGTTVHFVNVGQGNMALIQCADGSKFVVDCNITDGNQSRVLDYLAAQIGRGSRLHAFICTHRDADHMRGVQVLHKHFPIGEVWDSGYPGTSTDTPEYRAYMRLRNDIGADVKERRTRHDFGRTRFRYLSAKDGRLEKNANAQGIVLKVEHLSSDKAAIEGSTILTGDSDASTWKDGILEDYSAGDVSCDILLAGHHGSITFFDDPADEKRYYTDHIKAITPDMVIVSVGKNPHGHPDAKALELYEKYSTGSRQGNKVYRTDKQGTMKLVLKDGGSWNLGARQGE